MLVEQGAATDLIARTEALIAREEARVAGELAPYRPRLAGKRVLLYTGGVKSWSVVSALQEIGMVVIGTSVRKSTAEDKERIKDADGRRRADGRSDPGKADVPHAGRATPTS